MKKIALLILSVWCLSINAQIYNHKEVLDKFDDVIVDKSIKTLVQKTDSSFIIEEKGSKPIEYIILNFAEYNSMGDKDNIVNLVGNVYGYQECWSVVLQKDAANYYSGLADIINTHDDAKRESMIENLVRKYCYYIVHRVITTQYSHDFITELFWVQFGDHNGRTIYSNE